jgi:tRNA-dihydrouridine synthase A
MQTPDIVAACIAAMKARVGVPVTVKCRLGVDDQDIELALDALADAVLAAGADALWVHARKAWLRGLSPKENREIPPLDYSRVYRLKERLPDVFIGINGGITTLDAAAEHLRHVDGVMLGRAAYHDPAILAAIDRRFAGAREPDLTPAEAVRAMIPYIEAHLAAGGRLHHVARHMLGLFNGAPGARTWRRLLSESATREGGVETLLAALEAVARPRGGAAESRAAA